MNTLWKYADNTFEVVTRGSFKLMNILITDHYARCSQFNVANPAEAILSSALQDAVNARDAWRADYIAWTTCRGLYKGATQAFHAKVDELGSLKIRQWDAAIQGVFLEGTPEYTTLLPRGREPFQRGAFDERVAAVRTLSQTLDTYAALSALKLLVDTYLGELETLRQAQQIKETEVDACSAALEVQRVTTAKAMYRNLARFMLLWADNPVQIEDGFDMSYIRDGAPPPPEEDPVPPPPPGP